MRHLRRATPILAMLLLLGCVAQTATGQAVETIGVQKMIVRETAIQVIIMHEKKQLDDAKYAQAKAAYEKWASAERALADSVAAWIAVKNAANEDRVTVMMTQARDLTGAYLTVLESVAPGLLASVRAKLGVPPPRSLAIPLPRAA
jgi:hypothetical protein